MVLTVYFVLSPAIGLFCHRRLADWRFCPARLSRTSLRKTWRQRRGVRTTRLHRPQAAPSSCMPLTAHGEQSALRFASHAWRCCVHRISSRVRDDRDTPLVWDETAAVIEVIWVGAERKNFLLWDSTAPTTPNLARRAGYFYTTSFVIATPGQVCPPLFATLRCAGSL